MIQLMVNCIHLFGIIKECLCALRVVENPLHPPQGWQLVGFDFMILYPPCIGTGYFEFNNGGLYIF